MDLHKLYIMRKRYLGLLLFIPFLVNAQTEVTVDLSTTYQTVQGFGASDAWNCQYVGEYWTSSRAEVAKKLFSTSFDSDGYPEGIGLSRWRFNIGAGSYEQGDNSGIEKPERRAQCFLGSDGSYDWTKQAGQQWFLQQAKNYGVNTIVGFLNSPPYFYTTSGRANTDYTSNYQSTNLKAGYYDEFAAFMTTVLKHFDDEGLTINQISPVNETQYTWAGNLTDSQEGCPWKNSEIKELVTELNTDIENEGLSTEIVIGEAGAYTYIYDGTYSTTHANQIEDFFGSSSSNYIGDLAHVKHGISAHSYWTENNDSQIESYRTKTYAKCVQYDSLELYQSEYNLLNIYYNDDDNTNYLKNAVYLAKILHSDLVYGNVSTWDYWTAVERERWSQSNRFFLISLVPTSGVYTDDMTEGGTIEENKNLWAYGNYTLFIRPGYKRISLSGADDLSGLMGSAYISEDTSTIVEVYVNWDEESGERISHNYENLPAGKYVKSITPYVTNEDYNLEPQEAILPGDTYRIKALSVTTLVVELADSTYSDTTNNDTTAIIENSSIEQLEVYPNPATSQVTVFVGSKSASNATIYLRNMTGAVILEKEISTNTDEVINISDLTDGIYFLSTPNGCKKLVKR